MTTFMLANPDPGLTFGAVDLIGSDADLATQGYYYEALGTDLSWGNAVPIIQRIKSWLQDGTLAKLRGYDNRTMNVQIAIRALDLEKMAVASAALELECGKGNQLIYTPPDGVGAPCVFVIVTSNLEHDFDDFGEVILERIFKLKIEAKPFVRSSILTKVSRPAPTGASQTFTTIDNGSSFTNWAATYSAGGSPGSATISGTSIFGAVVAAATNFSGGRGLWWLRLTRTGLNISLATKPYLRVTLTRQADGFTPGAVTFYVNSTTVSVPVAVQEGNSYWLDTTGLGLSPVVSLRVQATFTEIVGQPMVSAGLFIDEVSQSDFLGTKATNRQLARTVPVAGTERTEGILALSDAANALGETLVYTSRYDPGVATPNLRKFLTSGNTQTSDGTNVSGFTSDLTTLHTFDIPVSQLASGAHSLVVRMKPVLFAPSAQTITWAAKSRMGSTNDTGQSGTTKITYAGTGYEIFEIALLNLPTRKMGADGLVRIELTAPAGSILDEAWIFNLDTGDLTWVILGTGTPAAGGPANRLWLDAATLENPNRAIYMGTEADRTDSVFVDIGESIKSFGNHEISPTAVSVFTITTGSIASLLELSHYACFGSYVVDP